MSQKSDLNIFGGEWIEPEIDGPRCASIACMEPVKHNGDICELCAEEPRTEAQREAV